MRAQLFEITHRTTYDYQSSVTVSHHLLKLSPRRMRRQIVLEQKLELHPQPASTSLHTDYFGNEVMFITVQGAHRQLEVIAYNRVAITPPFIPDATETSSWESVRGLCRTDRSVSALDAGEFMFASPLAGVGPAFTDYARSSFPAGRPILAAVLDLTARIFADFKFDPTATTVSTPLAQVLRQRRGVCQDFAHLQIACLRSLGLPARYVSGYLETLPPPGQTKLVGSDASHAWIAFFCPGIGWIDVDPTNNVLPSMQHITLGWGRDFGDISPIRGVLTGGDEHSLSVGVDVVARGECEIDRAPGRGVDPTLVN
jgi:transglutaminase-like putative cysteine protease